MLSRRIFRKITDIYYTENGKAPNGIRLCVHHLSFLFCDRIFAMFPSLAFTIFITANSATLQGHAFLRAHLAHLHGSKRPSGLVMTISGTIKLFFLSKP